MIVAAMGPSLDFLVNGRPGFFHGVPVVFAGIDQREIDGRNLGPDVTGVLVSREFKPTLEIALGLHPGTRRVVFIGGAAGFNKYWEERARRELGEFEDRVAITYLTDVAMADILREVATLPPDTIILFLHMFRDAAGHSFKPNEALSLIAQRATAPIYVFLDQYLGHGVVGGHVYSMEAHGAKAADIVLRILDGEKPASIPMLEGGTNVTMFDWRELRRWGIDENRLPPGAVVRFRGASFWGLYRWHVAAAVAIIAAQAALIVALLGSPPAAPRGAGGAAPALGARARVGPRRRRRAHRIDRARDQPAARRDPQQRRCGGAAARVGRPARTDQAHPGGHPPGRSPGERGDPAPAGAAPEARDRNPAVRPERGDGGCPAGGARRGGAAACRDRRRTRRAPDRPWRPDPSPAGAAESHRQRHGRDGRYPRFRAGGSSSARPGPAATWRFR